MSKAKTASAVERAPGSGSQISPCSKAAASRENLVRLDIDVVVEGRGGEFKEGEGDSARFCEGRGIVEAKNLPLHLRGKNRKRSGIPGRFWGGGREGIWGRKGGGRRKGDGGGRGKKRNRSF